MLCSEREFYAVIHKIIYIDICIYHTQRNYNICVHNKQCEKETKRQDVGYNNSQRELGLSSYTKLLISIFTFIPRRKTTAHVHTTSNVKGRRTDRVLDIIIPIENLVYRRFLCVFGEAIFRVPDSSEPDLSALSLERTYSPLTKKRRVIGFERLRTADSFYIQLRYIFPQENSAMRLQAAGRVLETDVEAQTKKQLLCLTPGSDVTKMSSNKEQEILSFMFFYI